MVIVNGDGGRRALIAPNIKDVMSQAHKLWRIAHLDLRDRIGKEIANAGYRTVFQPQGAAEERASRSTLGSIHDTVEYL